ncbi:hypothetical protein BH23VER1_BH23VER1_23300 [soil metagenome]
MNKIPLAPLKTIASLAAVGLLLTSPSSQAITVVVSANNTTQIVDFLNANFTNIDEIRAGNFANFATTLAGGTLTGADLFIIGRTLSSGDYDNGDSDGYNTLTIPVVSFTSYVSRQDGNRLGWHAGGATGDKSILGNETTLTAAGAALFGGSAGDMVDYYDMNPGDTFNGLGAGSVGGGEILATIGGDILAARWDTGDAPGNPTNAGVAVFPGDRLLFNLDNDVAGGTDDISNLTPAGRQALITSLGNVGLQAIPEPSSALLGLAGAALLLVRRRRR